MNLATIKIINAPINKNQFKSEKCCKPAIFKRTAKTKMFSNILMLLKIKMGDHPPVGYY